MIPAPSAHEGPYAAPDEQAPARIYAEPATTPYVEATPSYGDSGTIQTSLSDQLEPTPSGEDLPDSSPLPEIPQGDLEPPAEPGDVPEESGDDLEQVNT